MRKSRQVSVAGFMLAIGVMSMTGVTVAQASVRSATSASTSRQGAPIATGKAAPSATVNGCAQSFSADHGVCISVTTGSKNSSNHTQWVSQITVAMPTSYPPSKLEAWAGNGPTGIAWYQSTSHANSITWSINMWIKNQSGICGAYTYTDGSGRSIACITISA